MEFHSLGDFTHEFKPDYELPSNSNNPKEYENFIKEFNTIFINNINKIDYNEIKEISRSLKKQAINIKSQTTGIGGFFRFLFRNEKRKELQHLAQFLGEFAEAIKETKIAHLQNHQATSEQIASTPPPPKPKLEQSDKSTTTSNHANMLANAVGAILTQSEIATSKSTESTEPPTQTELPKPAESLITDAQTEPPRALDTPQAAIPIPPEPPPVAPIPPPPPEGPPPPPGSPPPPPPVLGINPQKPAESPQQRFERLEIARLARDKNNRLSLRELFTPASRLSSTAIESLNKQREAAQKFIDELSKLPQSEARDALIKKYEGEASQAEKTTQDAEYKKFNPEQFIANWKNYTTDELKLIVGAAYNPGENEIADSYIPFFESYAEGETKTLCHNHRHLYKDVFTASSKSLLDDLLTFIKKREAGKLKEPVHAPLPYDPSRKPTPPQRAATAGDLASGAVEAFKRMQAKKAMQSTASLSADKALPSLDVGKSAPPDLFRATLKKIAPISGTAEKQMKTQEMINYLTAEANKIAHGKFNKELEQLHDTEPKTKKIQKQIKKISNQIENANTFLENLSTKTTEQMLKHPFAEERKEAAEKYAEGHLRIRNDSKKQF